MSPASSLAVVAAGAADLAAIRALLAEAELPTADLADSSPIRFWLIREHGTLLGTVALERYDDVAMLGSLAVRPSRRGTGLGLALLEAAEQQATDAGIHTLCLLTTTAATLFARHGYERIERTDIPAEARQSEEFRSLCPASAICMIKQLSPR